MWITIATGVLTSLAAEVVHWVDKKLNGTVLKGTGSFLVATFAAFVGAGIRIAWDGSISIVDWKTFLDYFALVFTVGQLWFVLFYEKIGLAVKSE